jgi:hypothetical protein
MTPETTSSGGNASPASRSDAIHTFRQRLEVSTVLCPAGGDRGVALALVIPVGGSCCRQDSRNGDNLFCAADVLRSQRRSTQRSATAPTND